MPTAVVAVLSLILFTGTIRAQFPGPIESPTQRQPEQHNEAATKLLETISEGVSALRSPSNRISLSAAVADLLLPRDEQRARSILEALTKDFLELSAEIDLSDHHGYNALSRLHQQRHLIVERIARHDPELALSFVRNTQRDFAADRRFTNENERNLELHLATLIVSRDPGMALRLAREHLRKGVFSNHVSLLTQIKEKDPTATQGFFRDLVDRFAGEDLAENAEAFNAGWNLLTSFQPPQAHEQTYRRLLNLTSSRILAINPDDTSRLQLAQNLYHQVRWALPNIERIDSNRGSALRDWSRAVERTLDPNTRMYNEVAELSVKGSIEDLLALPSRYPPEVHTHIYQQAAWKALQNHEFERARQIAKDLIADPFQRQQLLNQIEQQMLWNAANQGDIGNARAAWGRTKSLDQRVQLMLQFAGNLLSKGEKKDALTILNEIQSLLEAAPHSSQRFNLRLQLVRTFLVVDAEQSVAVLQPMVSEINQLIAAAVVLEGFGLQNVESGEWLAQGHSELNNIINGLHQVLGQLAVSDFNRAATLTDQFERPEVRLMAQIAAVQGVLRSEGLKGGAIGVGVVGTPFIIISGRGGFRSSIPGNGPCCPRSVQMP